MPALPVPLQGLVTVSSGSADVVFLGTTKGEIVAVRFVQDESVAKFANGSPAIEAKVLRLCFEQVSQAFPKAVEDGLSWI